MESMTLSKLLLSYGVLGVVAIALAGYIMFLHKESKSERQEHREDKIKEDERWNSIIRQNTEAINGNTNVIESLKSLLESIDRRIIK